MEVKIVDDQQMIELVTSLFLPPLNSERCFPHPK